MNISFNYYIIYIDYKMTKERKVGVTTFLYVMIVFCYIFCHIDNGILAVCNESLGKDLGISES